MNKLLCFATAKVFSLGCQVPIEMRWDRSLVGVMLTEGGALLAAMAEGYFKVDC